MEEEKQIRRQRVSLPAQPLILLVRIYQVTLGLVMGGNCRFLPTCSEYSIQALQCHGAIKGGWLTIRRILRCHPFGGHGYDPVPECGGQKSEVIGRGSGVRGQR